MQQTSRHEETFGTLRPHQSKRTFQKDLLKTKAYPMLNSEDCPESSLSGNAHDRFLEFTEKLSVCHDWDEFIGYVAVRTSMT